ncbi:hypothetical protein METBISCDRAFT_27340 [Metschnikowia bicuspidata]|uniref:BHLH domain-containing protein n=1 Tax=Metschnikowia bicuspidata TaxID=27322 RepID=A0A4P9ZDQ4_9ASCO|nr:hypothetical protein METBISCDRAFT_27340 [Metschnikowia bicuspidata]
MSSNAYPVPSPQTDHIPKLEGENAQIDIEVETGHLKSIHLGFNQHPVGLTTSPNQNIFLDDQLLLQSIDGGLYHRRPSPGTNDTDKTPEHLQGDFNLDGMDLIMSGGLGKESLAFPPLNFPQNTPALVPDKTANLMRSAAPGAVLWPILPGQNQKSYNKEHLYHKQRQQRQQAQQGKPKHILSDAVFTPLKSPAGTPLEMAQSMVQLREFEPLTSPALKAQPLLHMLALVFATGFSSILPSERVRTLSTLGTDDYTLGSSAKRKTPHLTPNLAAHNTQSAHGGIKAKLPMPKVAQSYEKLPETVERLGAQAQSTETTPMPPHGKCVAIDSSGASSAGPGPMMGFTMNRLAEQQSGAYDAVPPVVYAKPHLELSRSSSQRSVDYAGWSYVSSLSETSPLLEAQQDTIEYGVPHSGKMPTKKTSHKLAEKGRRNRMNQAIQELAQLIPPSLHERALIPSKATTVELASKYISMLLKEIEELRRKQSEA